MGFLDKLFGSAASNTVQPPGYAFVSYSRIDKSMVQQFESYLLREELPPWRDNQIEYGESWQDIIVHQVHSCKAFLIIMSANSRKSEFVKREIALALNDQKMIIPILLDGEIFEELVNFQCVTMKSFWYTNIPFVERLRTILTPQQIPSSQLQRRRVEYAIFFLFEVILGSSNNEARVVLGIGFDLTFGVSLSDSLQELDELDWAEVFMELSRMFPKQNFNFNIGNDYGSWFPTIGHLVDYLMKMLTWEDIRKITIKYKPGGIGLEDG